MVVIRLIAVFVGIAFIFCGCSHPYTKPHSQIHTISNPHDLLVLVNKKNQLPQEHVPRDLVRFQSIQVRADAARALKALLSQAKKERMHLIPISGYRSYDTQQRVFDQSVAQSGNRHTEKYVAQPGCSEHQTGLAVDVGLKNKRSLARTFAKTPEAKWLANNAARFGFIIRYPKRKEHITGYAYEPWHIRYVGKKVANEIVEQDSTLEEYLA